MNIQVSSLPIGGNTGVPIQRDPKAQAPPLERTQAAEQVSKLFSNAPNPQPVELKQAVSDLDIAFNRRLKFVMDQDSSQLIVKVIDNETDKVIRVLPPEELQRLHSRIRETMGFLFDRVV